MENTWKRLLSFAIALVMVIGMMPGQVFAAEAESQTATVVTTEEELKTALAAGGEVKLGASITLTGGSDNGNFDIPAEAGKVTLNLNGNSITASARSGYENRTQYVFNNYADLTITGNGTITSRGIQNYSKLTVEAGVNMVAVDDNGGACIWNKTNGTIVINGGNFTAPGTNTGAGCVVDEQAAAGTTSVTITGGTFTTKSATTYAIILRGTATISNATVEAPHGCVASQDKANVTIDSGSYTTTGVTGKTDNVLYTSNSGILTVNGGTFVCDADSACGGSTVAAEKGSTGAITITGGSFSGSVGTDVSGNANTTITGGTFEKVSASYVTVGSTVTVAGKPCTKTENGLEEITYVAQLAGTDIKVTNLDDAFTQEVNPDGKSVLLIADCEQDVTIESGAYSFYMGGHTLTGTFKLAGGTVNFYGNLDGENEGKIQNTGLDGKYPIWCENGNFNLNSAVEITATGENGVAVYSNGSKLDITGNVTVNGDVKTEGMGILNITAGTYNGALIQGANSSLAISGGKFKQDPGALVPSGFEAKLVDGYYTLEKKPASLDDLATDAEGAYLISTPADVVTFRTLLNTAEGKNILSGEVFKLTGNIDMTGITLAAAGHDGKRFMGTFDGQNFTISNVNIQASTNYVAFFGNISGATIKNVTLHNVTANGSGYVAGLVGYARGSTIENCKLTGDISITGTGAGVAGILGGNLNASTITGCAVNGTGTISGSHYVGGLVGLGNGVKTVTNNTVNGISLTSDIGYVGGAIGNVQLGAAGCEISGNTVTNTTITSGATAQEDLGTCGQVVGSTFSNDASYTATYKDNTVSGNTATENGTTVNTIYSTNFNGNSYGDNVTIAKNVATVNGVGYATVLEAVAAAVAAEADTVTVLQSVREELTEDVYWRPTKDLTITADEAVTVAFYSNGAYNLCLESAQYANSTLTIDENVTIHSENRTIYIGAEFNNATIQVKGTLKGSQIWCSDNIIVEKTGKLITTSEAMILRYGSTLTVNGGQVDASYYQIYGCAINATDATLTGGAIWTDDRDGFTSITLEGTTSWTSTGNLKMSVQNYGVELYMHDDCQLSVTKFDGYDASDIGAGAVINVSGGDLSMDKTTLNGTLNVDLAASAKVTELNGAGEVVIEADNYTGTEACPVDIKVGSTFDGNYKVTGNDDLKMEIDENGKLVMEQVPDVAKIGDTYYKSLAEAVAALQSGETLVILKSFTAEANQFIELNGKTNVTVKAAEGVEITGNIDIGYHVSHIDPNVDRSNSTLTIQGLTVKGILSVHSNDASLRVCDNKAAQITVRTYREGMDISITGNEMDGTLGTVAKGYGLWMIPNATGYSLTADNNTFANNTDHAFVIQGGGDADIATAAESISLNGNTFTSWGTGGKSDRAAFKIWNDSKYAPAEGDLADTTNAMRELVQAIAAANTFSSTAENTVQFDAYGAAGNVEDFPAPVVMVAAIGTKGYATLKEAVEAATEGQTVTLLADVTLTGGYAQDAEAGLYIDKDVTIDGQGLYTIDCGSFVKGIRIYDGTVKLQNLTVVNAKAKGRCVDTRSNVELTLEKVTLKTTSRDNNQPLTIGGNDHGTKVTLIDTTIEAGVAGYAIINFVKSQVEIQNSTITGYGALYFKEGSAGAEFNVTNSTLNGENVHNNPAANSFAAITFEEDGVELNVTGGAINVTATGNAGSTAFALGNAIVPDVQGVEVNVSKSTTIQGTLLDGANIDKNTVILPAACADQLVSEGVMYAPVVGQDGQISVTGEALFAIGTTQYATLAAALADATAGQTVKLVRDVDMSGEVITLFKGITLDLNGYTLTALGVSAFKGDMVIDSGNAEGRKTGALKVSKDMLILPTNNAQIPVWNGVDGYQFASVSRGSASNFRFDTTYTGNGFKVLAKPIFGNAAELSFAKTYFTDGAADNGIQIVIRLTATTTSGDTVKQDYVYKDAMVQEVYSTSGKAFALTVGSLINVAKVEIQEIVIANETIQWASKALTYTAE